MPFVWRLRGQALATPALLFALPAVGSLAAETPQALYARAAQLEQAGRLDDAAAAYESAIRGAPRLAEAHDRLAFVRGRQGRTAEAIEGFRKAIALRPDLFDAHYHLGATLWWTKDAKGAAAALRTAVRLQAGPRGGAVLPGPGPQGPR